MLPKPFFYFFITKNWSFLSRSFLLVHSFPAESHRRSKMAIHQVWVWLWLLTLGLMGLQLFKYFSGSDFSGSWNEILKVWFNEFWAKKVLCTHFSETFCFGFRFFGFGNLLWIQGSSWIFSGLKDFSPSLLLQLDFPIGRTTGPSSSCCWHCLFFLCPLLSWNLPWAHKLTPKGVFMHVILCVDCFLFGNDIWREGFQKNYKFWLVFWIMVHRNLFIGVLWALSHSNFLNSFRLDGYGLIIRNFYLLSFAYFL